MWQMAPMLVIGQDGSDFWVVHESRRPFRVNREELSLLRGRVKKSRYRITTAYEMDKAHWPTGLREGMISAVSLFLDKPPAGSAKNFGLAGLSQFSASVLDGRTANGWGKRFPSGDRLKQVLIGKPGQPGLWDWIQTWGTLDGADRETYASFLLQAELHLGLELKAVARQFQNSASLWREMAQSALPSSDASLRRLKEIKLELKELRFEDPIGSMAARAVLAEEYQQRWEEAGDLSQIADEIRHRIAQSIDEIQRIESAAFKQLRMLLADGSQASY